MDVEPFLALFAFVVGTHASFAVWYPLLTSQAFALFWRHVWLALSALSSSGALNAVLHDLTTEAFSLFQEVVKLDTAGASVFVVASNAVGD